jgi:hypothetical protein
MARRFNEAWAKDYVNDQEKFIQDMVRLTTLEVWKQLTVDTPVDTGRARGSWVATSGKPSNYTPPEDGASYGLTPPKLSKKSRTNYVVSNLVYMPRLNEGHSPQAGPGFIGRSVEKAERKMGRLITKLIKKYDL